MAFNHDIKVVTGRVRLSYQHLDEPSAAAEGAEPKYSATLMIPKSDRATKAALDKAALAAIREKFGTEQLPKGSSKVYRDGDKESETKFDGGVDTEKNPEYAGHWIISGKAKATKKPILVGPGNTQIDVRDIYSGCYVRASLIAYGYDAGGNTGVGWALVSLKKVADGEPFGTVYDPSDDFGDDEDEIDESGDSLL